LVVVNILNIPLEHTKESEGPELVSPSPAAIPRIIVTSMIVLPSVILPSPIIAHISTSTPAPTSPILVLIIPFFSSSIFLACTMICSHISLTPLIICLFRTRKLHWCGFHVSAGSRSHPRRSAPSNHSTISRRSKGATGNKRHHCVFKAM
jgi:hypothetical protein